MFLLIELFFTLYFLLYYKPHTCLYQKSPAKQNWDSTRVNVRRNMVSTVERLSQKQNWPPNTSVPRYPLKPITASFSNMMGLYAEFVLLKHPEKRPVSTLALNTSLRRSEM